MPSRRNFRLWVLLAFLVLRVRAEETADRGKGNSRERRQGLCTASRLGFAAGDYWFGAIQTHVCVSAQKRGAGTDVVLSYELSM